MAAPNAMPQPVNPQSHVGFDSITSQIERKLLKRGFQFNVICVGMLEQPAVKVTYELTVVRSNRSGEVYAHQHHLCLPPYRLKGSSGS